MIAISKMAAAVQPSVTLEAGAKARQLRAEGLPVFDFSLGEPDFNTPEHICRAAFKAMQEGNTHYTPAAGIPELRAAVARRYQQTYGLSCTADRVIISNGAKHVLHNALAATCGPGDEVVIPTPYWTSYSEIVRMTGASWVLVETRMADGWKMTPGQFRAALTPRTRLLMINSPANPTGIVYTRAELGAIADVALEAGIAILSDEIYENLVYGSAKATCVATLRPGLADRTITVSGVSKSYAMTGWRIGWAVAPRHVTEAMATIQSQQTSNPNSVSQYAALAALQGDQQCVEAMRREFEARRDLVCRRLREMPGLPFHFPDGAFYVFVRVADHFGRTLGGRRVTDSAGFCQAALEAAQFNAVPGSAFGAEGFIRISYAASREQIVGGMDRLERFLK
jgi:aspartate aminotransferase